MELITNHAKRKPNWTIEPFTALIAPATIMKGPVHLLILPLFEQDYFYGGLFPLAVKLSFRDSVEIF